MYMMLYCHGNELDFYLAIIILLMNNGKVWIVFGCLNSVDWSRPDGIEWWNGQWTGLEWNDRGPVSHRHSYMCNSPLKSQS